MKVLNITKGILGIRLIPTSEIKRKAGETFSEEASSHRLPLVARDTVAAEKLNCFCYLYIKPLTDISFI